MDTQQNKLYIKRAKKMTKVLFDNFLFKDKVLFDVHYCKVKAGVHYNYLNEKNFKSLQIGEEWGSTWERAWFKFECKIPEDWKLDSLVSCIDINSEGLVYSQKSKMIQGISHGSTFDHSHTRYLIALKKSDLVGKKLCYWIEGTANQLFGLTREDDPNEYSPHFLGHHTGQLKQAYLVQFDYDIWHYLIEIYNSIDLINQLPNNSRRKSQLLYGLNESINEFNEQISNIGAARKLLRNTLINSNAPSDLNTTAVGHAHIDTGWLWPVSESVRKCARTFSTQLDLIDRYPDYIFGASQAQHYMFVKEHYPELYERIKKAIVEGRWEVQGGMWVEADCNIPSGESLVRQFIHGKNFFKDEFNLEIENLWLPDVFGYAANLPQILKGAGVKYFLTQKISWNQFNKFPHHTFWWEGIDGTKILSHFPPEDTYNSSLNIGGLAYARDKFAENHILDEFLTLFGVGDGGGGPKEEHIESGILASKGVEGVPKLKFGRADEFFTRLELKARKIPLHTWRGELYLELHRGTLTTQAKVKWANRKLEYKLRELEFLYSLTALSKYPQKELDAIWKTVLLNQFHDIIPGSSINEVYEVTHKEHKLALKHCEKLKQEWEGKYNGKELTLFNSWNFPINFTHTLPEDWANHEVLKDGEKIPAQIDDLGVHISLTLQSFESCIISQGKKITHKKTESLTIKSNAFILENSLIRYTFSKSGKITGIFDKECKREVLSSNACGNILCLYTDRPADWDAWDIDIYYEDSKIKELEGLIVASAQGELQSYVKLKYEISNKSHLEQEIILTHDSKLLKFVNKIEWHEKHKMLKTAFDTNISSMVANCDIQYGYIPRPTHRNTSWDMAKFEICAHKYIDISELEYGVALLNDCKYGHKALDGRIEMTLLRSPTLPDPLADQGNHEITYALLPHSENLPNSTVQEQSRILNQGPSVLHTRSTFNMPFQIVGNEKANVVLEVLKKAEKEDALIIRLVENKGKHSQLSIDVSDKYIAETNLMEWKHKKFYKGRIKAQFRPFEIKTYIIKIKI